MRIIVKSENPCLHYEQAEEQYGSWYRQSEFIINSVRRGDDDDEKTRYGEDGFLVLDGSEVVYVLSMQYSSGDSFGHETGLGTVLHVFGDYDRGKAALEAFKVSKEYNVKFKDDFDREVSMSNPAYGYFESIESLDLDPYNIGPEHKPAINIKF